MGGIYFANDSENSGVCSNYLNSKPIYCLYIIVFTQEC